MKLTLYLWYCPTKAAAENRKTFIIKMFKPKVWSSMAKKQVAGIDCNQHK